MTYKELTELTSEQEEKLWLYRDKWKKKAFSTTLIDKKKATAAIHQAYQLVGYALPHEILFFPSPRAANHWIMEEVQRLNQRLLNQNSGDITYDNYIFSDYFHQAQVLATLLDIKLSNHQELKEFLTPYQKYKLNVEIEQNLRNQSRVYRALLGEIKTDVYQSLKDLETSKKKEIFTSIAANIKPEELAIDAGKLDFARSVLNYSYPEKNWKFLEDIIDNCGWIYPFAKTCLVCERPEYLSFDSENRPHAEGKPALKFADGFSVYANHGVILPEKYGKLPPQQWQPQWLLNEPNGEIRRVLIQGIGYGRLCLELDATELDSWREYTLLAIDHNLDVEPIHLLKMVCPSTEHIHVLRVPPEMQTSREAINWANWGIDPEEFSIST